MNMKFKQRGATLVELMIGLALSLIVTASMVGLMSNSLGTTTRVIQMSQLTDEMRNAMSMLSRDVRRANYSAHAIYCYSNADCATDGTTKLADVTINGSNNCLFFDIDRKQNNFQASDAAPGGFRHSTRDGDGVGFIEMWVGGTGVGCDTGNDWFALTDPDFVDITAFTITPTQYEETVEGEGGSTVHQRTTQVKIEMQGTLRLEPTIVRRIEDTIKVRNDVVWRTAPAA